MDAWLDEGIACMPAMHASIYAWHNVGRHYRGTQVSNVYYKTESIWCSVSVEVYGGREV